MRFIAACVGFSLLVLLGLMHPLVQSELGFSSDSSKRITKIVRTNREDPQIGIHQIIVFNTKPKTFAITGKSNSIGRRELLTAIDSVLLFEDNIGWARDVFDSFDWTDKEDPEFMHRGSTVPFYNLDTLYESGLIKEIYREEQTYGFYNPTVSPGVIMNLISIFLLSFFVLSISLGWRMWQRILFVFLLSIVVSLVTYSIYFFGDPTSKFYADGKLVVTIHSIHWLIFGLIAFGLLLLKSKTKSRYIFQGLYYLILVFAFPIAYLFAKKVALAWDEEFCNSVYYYYSNFKVVTENMIIGMGMGLASLAVFVMNNYKETERVKNKALQSQMNTKNQLNSLNARLNPHFLYNSLNSIAGLIDPDPRKAEDMTLAISRFLKHFSNRKGKHVITVREEVAVILDYISIEKIRFEEKLYFEYEVDETAMEINIPRSILQPLIENAVKYGYSEERELLEVRLEINHEDERLVIRIYDSGKDFDTTLDKGYGISSVYNKLDLLCKEDYRLEFINEPKKHIEISITTNIIVSHE